MNPPCRGKVAPYLAAAALALCAAVPAAPAYSASTATPPPPMDGDLQELYPGIGQSEVTGGQSSVWSATEMRTLATSGQTNAGLSGDGRLYMWGELDVDHHRQAFPLPAQIELPEEVEPLDMALIDGQAVILEAGGDLYFVDLTRDAGQGTLVGQAYEPEDAPGEASTPVWNCAGPYEVPFVGEWVQDAEGNLCELIPEAHEVLTDSYMPRAGALTIESIVMLGDRLDGAGAVALTQMGELYSLTQDEGALAKEKKKAKADKEQKAPAQWNATPLADKNTWMYILPDTEQTGALAVSQEGSLVAVDAKSGELSKIETPGKVMQAWFSQNREGEAAYVQLDDGAYRVLYQDANGATGRPGQTGRSSWTLLDPDNTHRGANELPVEEVELGETALSDSGIATMALDETVVLRANTGQVYTLGGPGASGIADKPQEVAPSPSDEIFVDGEPVTVEVSEKGWRSINAPAHALGTVPVSVTVNGEQIPYGDFTYTLSPDVTIGDVADVDDGQLIDMTLTIPEEARELVGAEPLYVVARADSLLPFDEETSGQDAVEKAEPARSMPVIFDDDEAPLRLLLRPGDTQHLLVVSESTPRETIDAQLGTHIDLSGPYVGLPSGLGDQPSPSQVIAIHGEVNWAIAILVVAAGIVALGRHVTVRAIRRRQVRK